MSMESAERETGAANVMIVEDEPVMNELVGEILQFNGFRTQGFFTGEDAVLWCSHHVPQIALVDIMLPGISGYEVVHQLKSSRRTLGVATLILSSLDRHEARLRAVRAGADAYISKPFEPESLIDEMNQTLQRVRRYRNLPVEGHITISSREEMVFLQELNHLLLASSAIEALGEEQVRMLRAGLLDLYRNLDQWDRARGSVGVLVMKYHFGHDRLEILINDAGDISCATFGQSPQASSLADKVGDFVQQAGQWGFLDECSCDLSRGEIRLLRRFA